MKNELIVFTDEQRSAFDKSKKAISNAISRIEGGYLSIVGDVHRIYAGKLYEIDGYKNIYDFTRDNFEMSRQTTSNLNMISNRFGNDKGELDKVTKSLGVRRLLALKDVTSDEMDAFVGYVSGEFDDIHAFDDFAKISAVDIKDMVEDFKRLQLSEGQESESEDQELESEDQESESESEDDFTAVIKGVDDKIIIDGLTRDVAKMLAKMILSDETTLIYVCEQ